MAGKVISFGYARRALVPKADQVVDVRDLGHDMESPDVEQRVNVICHDFRPGQTIAIGCEQGKHRSVTIAQRVAEKLKLRLQHRDQ